MIEFKRQRLDLPDTLAALDTYAPYYIELSDLDKIMDWPTADVRSILPRCTPYMKKQPSVLPNWHMRLNFDTIMGILEAAGVWPSWTAGMRSVG